MLESIPNWIGNFTALEGCSLANCKLKTLPASLVHLPKLKWLNLSGNPLLPEPGLCKMLAEMRQRGCFIKCDPLVDAGIRQYLQTIQKPQ